VTAESYGSLILGITLCGFAGWLHWQELNGWPNESFETELDHRYRNKRTRARRRIHLIIGGCGILILVAAFAGHGPLWIVSWMCVIAGLIAVVFLAAIDAFRTHRYHCEKLPEIRREILGEDE
jgi:hypothetical protein